MKGAEFYFFFTMIELGYDRRYNGSSRLSRTIRIEWANSDNRKIKRPIEAPG